MDENQKKNLWDNLQAAFAASGLTQREFAKKLGITPAYLNGLLKRKKSGERILLNISNVLNIPVEVLLSNRMEISDVPPIIPKPIPLISWVQAGDFEEAVDNWSPGESGEGEAVYARKIVSPRSFALRVIGDSMQGRYMEGDIIIVDPELEPGTGDPCIVWLNGDVTFKRLRCNGANEIRLQADNPKYPEIVIQKDSPVDIKIIGKVVDLVPKSL